MLRRSKIFIATAKKNCDKLHRSGISWPTTVQRAIPTGLLRSASYGAPVMKGRAIAKRRRAAGCYCFSPASYPLAVTSLIGVLIQPWSFSPFSAFIA
jgi:hypothetical protein